MPWWGEALIGLGAFAAVIAVVWISVTVNEDDFEE